MSCVATTPKDEGRLQTIQSKIHNAIRFVARCLSCDVPMLLLTAASVITAALCAIGAQYSMKLIVDLMATGGRSNSDVWWQLSLIAGAMIAESVLWRTAGWSGSKLVVSAATFIRLELFARLVRQPASYFVGQLSGALSNRFTACSNAVKGIASALIWRILPPATDLLGSLVVICIIDGRVGIAVFVGACASVAVTTEFASRGTAHHQEYAKAAAHAEGRMLDVVTNIWNVMAFGTKDRERERLESDFFVEATAHRSSWMQLEKARVAHDLLSCVVAVGLLGWCIASWRRSLITAGDVAVITALSFRMLHGTRDMVLAVIDATQQIEIVSEALSVLDVPRLACEHKDLFSPIITSHRRPQIRFNHVRFGYGHEQPVLRHINVCIPFGQRVGIIGPSGSGKSTLLALMQRLYDVEVGSIMLGDIDISQASQQSIVDLIAVVPQDVRLFHRTVFENIRYGRPNATENAVREAASLALCEEFIDNLPSGYDTVVGEHGARLSGGQRQRIGIARALLKRAPVLILDEATSALDSQTEHEVQTSIARLKRETTVLAVSHRPEAFGSFDRILVLAGGRIVEDGHPSVVLRANRARSAYQLAPGATDHATRKSSAA